MIGIGIGIDSIRRGGASDAIAAALASRAGISWQPWKYRTTMFTDTAGTVPASAPGDVIAVQKCPVKIGAQFQQLTLANRPILLRHPKSGRRNLLTYTEDFSNAAWQKNNLTISANTVAAPDGATTADTLTGSGVGGTFLRGTHAYPTGAVVRWSVYAKAGTSANLTLGDVNIGAIGTFNISTGVVVSGASAQISDAGGGWHRCSVEFTPIGAGSITVAPGSSIAPVTTGSIHIWGAQLETGSTATAYQKVTSPYDITEAGFADCWGLYHDAVNASMATAATLDLSGSDKVGVFMGVQKQQVAAQGMLLEHSATAVGNVGTFYMIDGTKAGAGASYAASARGAAATDTGQGVDSAASFPALSDDVVTALHDIAGDLTTLRVDGAVSGTPATGDKGAGNFGNYTTYKGSRGGASLFFSGIDWGGVIVGGLTTADTATIAAIEAQIAANTPGVTL